MAFFDRRRFLLASAAATLASLRGSGQAPDQAPGHAANITLHPDEPGVAVPPNFLGLSYETLQLSDRTFFSPHNRELIAQFRKLAAHGVLRIGGNTSDVSWWKATSDARPPEFHVRTTPGEPSGRQAFSIGPEAVRSLRGFLDATGWSCIYGINLGTGTPSRAAEQAAFVAKALGDKLEYFQLGNEPDLYVKHLRDPQTWSADAYLDEWLAMANAILAVVPAAKFGLPDTGGQPDWYGTMETRLAKSPILPSVAALSHHYYFGGPPSNPKVNVELLLQPNPKVLQAAAGVSKLAANLSKGLPRPIPYRMTEGNTCYQGGKPGVSDVFAAALWAADYLLLLASLGYAGINLHGGDAKIIANGLGGILPGEALMTDSNTPHPRPFYTPIARMGDSFVAEPVSYGMRFAQHFAGATMFKLNFDPGPVNATAYAAKLPNGSKLLAVINKDAAAGLSLSLAGARQVYAISAASLTSTAVSEAPISQPNDGLSIPPSSAIVFRLGNGRK